MFVVYYMMVDCVVNYVCYYGDSFFFLGGSFYDIMFCMKNYGFVLQDVMLGIMYGDLLFVYNELDVIVGVYVNVIVKGNLKKLILVWKKGFCVIYDIYLG